MEPVAAMLASVRLLVAEARRRILALSVVFAVIALGALGIGAIIPKHFECQTILLAESKNIITPLMAGRAVPTTTGSEEAQIVRQAFLSHRVLREVLAAGGWSVSKDPVDEARALERLARQITIQSQRREVIRISYRDTDAARALRVTNKLAELYIRESTVGKERESRDAVDFIERQVNEYQVKAEEAHAKVLAYERRLEARRPGPGLPRAPVARPAPEVVAALTTEEAALAAELAATELRSGRRVRAERMAVLERELETLLGSFTENHPNVRRVRQDLQVLRQEEEKAGGGEDPAVVTLRRRLEQVRLRLAAANPAQAAAPAAAAPTMTRETSPELRGVGQDAALSELVHRYEATRQVYQDLLVRRENARVSMEMEAQHGGVSVRVYEPAELPVVPSGPRLLHVAMAGLFLATAAPIALVVALLRLDPRVRSTLDLERLNVPLLAGIPHVPTLRERLRTRRHHLLAALVVFGVLATYVGLFLVRLTRAS